MGDLISNTVGEILKGQDKNPSKEDPVILIDAVKLIKEMYEDGAFPLEMADVLMERICNQPTAYNVDKVVEQIVTLHVEGHCPSEDDDECILNKTCNDCFEERVKNIVKAGGVNE